MIELYPLSDPARGRSFHLEGKVMSPSLLPDDKQYLQSLMSKLEHKLHNHTSEERYHDDDNNNISVKAKLSTRLGWLTDLNDAELTRLLIAVTGYDPDAFVASAIKRTVRCIFPYPRYYLVLSRRL